MIDAAQHLAMTTSAISNSSMFKSMKPGRSPADSATVVRAADFNLSDPANKRAIIGLVERVGSVRMFHVAVADKATVAKIVTDGVAKEAHLVTDESKLYGDADQFFADHSTVKHSAGEYVRYQSDRVVHTNTIEGVFGIFKRGMAGIYQHRDEKQLHRYLEEYGFRYSYRSRT